MHERRLWVGGDWVTGERSVPVHAPFDGRPVASVAQASDADVERALAFADEHRGALAAQSTGVRREVLHKMVAGLRAREKDFVDAVSAEAGKPVRAARAELRRAVETFTLAAAELSSFGGRTVPIDLDADSAGYTCETRRVPAGVVVGVVPFNFPLNLGAHKVAPALAVGAPIIVKPPPQAPSAQLLLAEVAQAAGAHPAALQVLPCDNARAERLATDPRVRVLSFTGSAKVGWSLKSKAAGKVVLELGGNAAVVVCADADLAWAAQRCALGGFGYAGQVCIKVQRIYVERAAFGTFLERLLEATGRLVCGDPASEEVSVGPVIDDASAERIEAWVQEAVDRGARPLLRGQRKGRVLSPTLLTNVPPDVQLAREEVFGPVVVVEPVDDFDTALRAVNASRYGLQAGLFTRDLGKVRRAFRELEVGGLVANDYPTFRSDNAPYGGVKDSGLGREGVRSAMEELTEERVLVIAPR